MKVTSLASVPEEGVSHNPEIRKRVLLRRGDVPHLTNFSQARVASGQTATAHAHPDMHEIFFVESGDGEMTVGGEKHRLTPGVCIAIAPGEVHEVHNPGPEALVLTYFGISV